MTRHSFDGVALDVTMTVLANECESGVESTAIRELAMRAPERTIGAMRIETRCNNFDANSPGRIMPVMPSFAEICCIFALPALDLRLSLLCKGGPARYRI